jgi:protein-tyrosine phosphatase
MARGAGVGRIVATPHFYPHRDTLEAFLARRDRCAEELFAARDPGCSLDIRLGAEVLICQGIERLEGLDKLCISGTRAIMLELPVSTFSSSFIACIDEMIGLGYDIILAHADRYEPENVERLIEVGAKIQLNASALATVFKKKHLYSWIERGHVVALGSDIHMRDKGAYAAFVKAIRKLGSLAEQIMKSSDSFFVSPCTSE